MTATTFTGCGKIYEETSVNPRNSYTFRTNINFEG